MNRQLENVRPEKPRVVRHLVARFAAFVPEFERVHTSTMEGARGDVLVSDDDREEQRARAVRQIWKHTDDAGIEQCVESTVVLDATLANVLYVEPVEQPHGEGRHREMHLVHV